MNNILWVDDEIELLKPHIIYLQSKGYNLTTAKSGDEALDIIENASFNLIFLDENMPGLSGLETLNIIKDKYQNIPVVMITKSEEESIMEEAIGSKISEILVSMTFNQLYLHFGNGKSILFEYAFKPIQTIGPVFSSLMLKATV